MDKTHLSISNFDTRTARRLLAKALLFAPVLLMVLAVNLYLDPAGLYRDLIYKNTGLEERIAQALIEGTAVSPPRDIDDRLVEKYLIEKMTAAPDIVILGSSHSMWLGNNIFPDSKVINNSVIRAVLPDYLGIFENYANKNLYPRRVILLLDPQLIGLPFISEKWLSIKEDTRSMLDRLGIRSRQIKQPLIEQKWFNLFSFSYFQEAMERLRNSHKTGRPPFWENGRRIKIGASGQLFFKDGRRLWSSGAQLWDTEKNRQKTVGELVDGINEQLLRRTKPDKELEYILEDFIRYLTRHHVQVTLCMLPLHPEVYKNFLDMHERRGTLDIIGIEHYYHGLAQRLNLAIVGSFDPAFCGLSGKDFYDGDHIRNGVIEKMFKQKDTRYPIL